MTTTACLSEIPVEDLLYVLNEVEEAMITEQIIKDIENYSDTTKYSTAEFFKCQLIHSFYRMIQERMEENPREMTFDEIKHYLQDYMNTPPVLMRS